MRGTTMRHGPGRPSMRLAALFLVAAAVLGCGSDGDGTGAGGSGGEGGSTTTGGQGGGTTSTTTGGQGGGSGGCSPVDDGNPCTDDVCEGGAPVSLDMPVGAPCDQGGGKVCDGRGHCVECTETADCDVTEACFENVCVAADLCADLRQNGDETDVDCGGSCPPCDDGQGCSTGDDCQSGVCDGAACAPPTCGDGVINGFEICDDGNTIDGDGCNHLCMFPECGDGLLDPGEECEDGNFTNGDGCDDGPGGNCTVTACGNGVVSPGEICDDGNMTGGDGCDDGPGGNCTVTACGNGVVSAGEICDDGNTSGGDGCSATCAVEPGFICMGSPSQCVDGGACELDLDNCDENATCVDVPGGFQCICDVGYVGDGVTCTPI